MVCPSFVSIHESFTKTVFKVIVDRWSMFILNYFFQVWITVFGGQMSNNGCAQVLFDPVCCEMRVISDKSLLSALLLFVKLEFVRVDLRLQIVIFISCRIWRQHLWSIEPMEPLRGICFVKHLSTWVHKNFTDLQRYFQAAFSSQKSILIVWQMVNRKHLIGFYFSEIKIATKIVNQPDS